MSEVKLLRMVPLVLPHATDSAWGPDDSGQRTADSGRSFGGSDITETIGLPSLRRPKQPPAIRLADRGRISDVSFLAHWPRAARVEIRPEHLPGPGQARRRHIRPADPLRPTSGPGRCHVPARAIRGRRDSLDDARAVAGQEGGRFHLASRYREARLPALSHVVLRLVQPRGHGRHVDTRARR